MTPPISLPEFHTARLYARPLNESDLHFMHKLHRNADVMKYIHKPEETYAALKRAMDYHERNPLFGM